MRNVPFWISAPPPPGCKKGVVVVRGDLLSHPHSQVNGVFPPGVASVNEKQ